MRPMRTQTEEVESRRKASWGSLAVAGVGFIVSAVYYLYAVVMVWPVFPVFAVVIGVVGAGIAAVVLHVFRQRGSWVRPDSATLYVIGAMSLAGPFIVTALAVAIWPV